MIHCDTYDEAKLEAIHLLSVWDCEITKIKISYSEIYEDWIVETLSFTEEGDGGSL